MKLLSEFKTWLGVYNECDLKRKMNAAQPWTDDPVMNAYDLCWRPDERPSEKAMLDALELMGAKVPKWADRGAFIYGHIICLRDVTGKSLPETERLILAFATYRQLSEGRLKQWKKNVH